MRDFSTAARHANKARMLRTSRSNCSILFVEGDTDSRFYGQFVCHKSCSILNTSGRQHAIDAGEILFRDGFRGFLVLADRDDWSVDGLPSLNYVVATDDRDLESTLLRGGIGLRLLAQHGDRGWIRKLEEKSGKSLLDLIAEWTAVLGVIRWISNRESRKLTTKDFDLTDFVNWDRLTVSVEDVATQILRRSGGSGGIPFNDLRDDLARRSTEKLGTTPDKWVFCSGHDLCLTLMRGLIRKFGNNESAQLTIELFEASVRACCSPGEFANTKLCRMIKDWERRNVPFQVLAK